MNNRQSSRNLALLYAFRTLRTAMLIMPVIVPFFHANGLNQAEIFWLQAAFAMSLLVLEIPGGWFADRVGRKKSLVLGAVLLTFGFSMYATVHGFWALVMAEIVLGIGSSFVSGADIALAYDSLKAAGREKYATSFESRGTALEQASLALSSIAGGALAVWGVHTVFYVQIGISALLIPLALALYEPPRVTTIERHNPFVEMARITRYTLHGHQEIKWLILYSAVASTMTHTVIWMIQPYYDLAGVPIAWYGVAWAIPPFAAIGFALLASHYQKLGRRVVFTSLVVITVTTYLVLGFAPANLATLSVVLGFSFVRAMYVPIMRTYINRLVQSDIRATVHSVQSFAHKVLYCAAGPLIGHVAGWYDLQTALAFSGLLYGSLGAVALVCMGRAGLLKGE